MNWTAFALIAGGYYLLDCALKNRPPIGTIEALIKDPSDLSGTVSSLNGTWTNAVQITPKDSTNETAGEGNLSPNISNARNGRLAANELKSIPFALGQKLIPSAADSLVKMNEAYKKEFGRNISITDSYRTYAQQVAVKRNKGNLAATPGTSNHGLGRALDLGGGVNTFGTKQHIWMVKNGPSYGWYHPDWAGQFSSKPEPWHFEYRGA
jgi:LAS superfamily LD-carboxypeptidase LdcB